MQTHAVEQSATTRQSAGEPGRSFRVLLIDDNEVAREVLAGRLSRAWPFEQTLELHYAGKGWEALEQMHTFYFHMIFVECVESPCAGCEVLRALRNNGVRIPAAVVSGPQHAEIADSLESHGAVFLDKDELTESSVRHAIATALQTTCPGRGSLHDTQHQAMNFALASLRSLSRLWQTRGAMATDGLRRVAQ